MRRDEHEDITDTLSKNHECYILITCDAPTEDGEMHVEMSYGGDSRVAAYLLEGAQTAIAEQHDAPCHLEKVTKLT